MRITRYILYILLTIATLASCDDETKVKSVKLFPSEMAMKIGEKRQIEMIISPLSASKYNPTAWESSNPNIAKVDNRGNVTAIYSGECIITGKAMHESSTCKIRVEIPKYELSYNRGLVFDQGISKDNGLRNMILRLHDSTLEIDDNGNATGNGSFINLQLLAPDKKELTEGEYSTENKEIAFSLVAGEIIEENGNQYATGSYLGIYSEYGLSAIFIKEGKIEIKKGEKHTINCQLIGNNNEIITIEFSGDVKYIDNENRKEVEFFYNNVITNAIEVEGENILSHQRVTLQTKDNIEISMILRLPKSSAHRIPDGKYYINEEIKPYTIVNKNGLECKITDKNQSIETKITSGYIKKSTNNEEIIYIGELTDEKGIRYKIVKESDNKRCFNILETIYRLK